jgi:hypothetical protein
VLPIAEFGCAPVKPESMWVQVPPIQLDCSGSKTASGMKP